MKASTTRSLSTVWLWLILAAIAFTAAVAVAADDAWKWSGSFGDDAVELLILGDIQIQKREDPASAFAHLHGTLARADLVYANLEGMLVRSQGNGIDIPDKTWIHPGPEGARGLKASNIRVVGVANNVAYGRENILETLKVLDQNGIAHVGAGKNIEEAHRPAMVERNGVTFGFLQYTARWYRQEEQIATATEAGVARMMSEDGVTIDEGDLERLREDVKALRPKVDILVVSHHNRDGGTPVQFGPAPKERPRVRPDRTLAEAYQKQFAHTALDSGADLVYGHGTHTVQGVELYKGKPILYAIGHSAFDQPGYEDATDGLVIRAVVKDKKLARVSFVPVTRDEHNDVLLLDPSLGEGDRLLKIVKKVSGAAHLPIDGQEVVLLDGSSGPTENEDR